MSKVNTSIAAAMPAGRVARRLRIGLLAATALTIGSIGFVNSYNTVAVRAETAGAEVVTPFGRAPLSFADVIEKVSGSVVSIYVTNGGGQAFSSGGPDLFPDLPDDHPLKDFFKKFGKGGPDQPGPQAQPSLAQGSGFVISADGYVVTNNHVVADASKVEISFDEQIKLPADVIGKDARTDLALLKIKSDKSFPFVPFAEKKVRVGDWVIAIGNPFGLGGTVTAGIVSAASRDIGSGPYDYLQIDAAVNRGNSGGPAFNLDGEVIGVNSAIFSPSGGNVGIAFAIPADLARRSRRSTEGERFGQPRLARRPHPERLRRDRPEPRHGPGARRADHQDHRGRPFGEVVAGSRRRGCRGQWRRGRELPRSRPQGRRSVTRHRCQAEGHA